MIVVWGEISAAPALKTIEDLADVYYNVETREPILNEKIKQLNGKRIRIAGYMVPFDSLTNLQTFMLMPSSNGCDFCANPRMEEAVYIKQAGAGNKWPYIEKAISVEGILTIVPEMLKGQDKKEKAAFLYAIEEAKVEILSEQETLHLGKPTVPGIFRQVCSLLNTDSIKPLTYISLNETEWRKKNEELLKKYDFDWDNLTLIAQALDFIPSNKKLESLVVDFLVNWHQAFSNDEGTVLYYHESLNVNQHSERLQLARAAYEVLFQQQVPLSPVIHDQKENSMDSKLARLALVTGLRTDFLRFYDSIPNGPIAEPSSAEKVLKPWRESEVDKIRQQYPKLDHFMHFFLGGQSDFIEAVNREDRFVPYTLALEDPPKSSQQIIDIESYLNLEKHKNKAFAAKGALGAFFYQSLLGGKNQILEGYMTDVYTVAGEWRILSSTWENPLSEKEIQKVKNTLKNNFIVNIQKETDSELEIHIKTK